uniref:Uncharacterized protein n=1 Tax=Arundo donax TaxID=35708 RepID=A0A0A9E3V7_ARUDO
MTERHVEAQILSNSTTDYLVSLQNCFCNLAVYVIFLLPSGQINSAILRTC